MQYKVKPQLARLASSVGASWGLGCSASLIQLPAKNTSGKKGKADPTAGSSHLPTDSQSKPAQARHRGHLGSEPEDEKSLVSPLNITVSKK